MLLSIFGLASCSNSHGIPNGDYIILQNIEGVGTTYALLPKGKQEDYFLRIKGKKATWYASNQKSSEYKIIIEENEVYFVRDASEYIEAKKLLVKYDETLKEFTIYNSAKLLFVVP